MSGFSVRAWGILSIVAALLCACSGGGSNDGVMDSGVVPDADASDGDAADASTAEPDFIAVSADKRGFVHSQSGEPFVVYGVNYTNRATGEVRLVEELWDSDWATLEGDFAEMRDLHYTVVRISFQIVKFMADRDTPIDAAFDKLVAVADLAHANGLTLDVTGLADMRAEDAAEWYDALNEADRWKAQENFWRETARRLREHPAVFVYNLMNEPLVTAEPHENWFLGETDGLRFTQLISLDVGERSVEEVAAAWMAQLSDAIREEDPNHLVTVGNLPFLAGGFAPENVAPYVDYLSVHIYPESADLERSLEVVAGFQQGKPVVVEEIFLLFCTAPELKWFMGESMTSVAGMMGFYFGIPRAELLSGVGGGSGVLTLATLDAFEALRPDFAASSPRAIPVHRYWSAANSDHFYTDTPNDDGYALIGYAASPEEDELRWAVDSIKTADTVPLCTPFDGDLGNHTVSVGCTDGDTLSITGLLGWARTTPGAGYVALHHYRSATTGDTVLTVAQNDEELALLGYADYEGVVAYVRQAP